MREVFFLILYSENDNSLTEMNAILIKTYCDRLVKILKSKCVHTQTSGEK